MSRSGRAAAAAFAVVLLLTATAACSKKPSGAPTGNPSTTEEPLPTVAPTSVRPTVVTAPPGRPRTTIQAEPSDIQGGGARIGGKVIGPQGDVGAATVRVERYVGDDVSTVNLLTNAAGQFSLASVRGGSYRLQAWKAPDLLLLEPEEFFMAADETKAIDLKVTRLADVNVRHTISSNRLPQDEPFTVDVFLFAAVVSDQGSLQAAPRPNETMQITFGTPLGGVGTLVGRTDSGGNVRFQGRCLAPGQGSAEVTVSTFRFRLDLPACR